MILLLFGLFIALPIAEIYVIVKVGEAIGILPTIALLILDSVIGTALLRQQGRGAWRRFRAALEENRLPHREVFDGAMVILGGALLVTPGFITDVFGVICLLPPTRAIVWALTKRTISSRVGFGPRVATWGYTQARPGQPGPGPQPGGPRPTGPRPDDIEGTAEEIPDQGPELPGGEQR